MKNLHEHHREYTEAELNKLKENKCIKHNCRYLSHFNGTSDTYPGVLCCDYIGMTGRRRNCTIEECEHYKEGKAKKKWTNT